MPADWLPAVGTLFLIAGCALATIGIYGLLLKPDLFDQLHVAGLVTGPGVILALVASVATRNAEIITSAMLMLGFVLITSSISTHALAQAGVRRYRPSTRPALVAPDASNAGDLRPARDDAGVASVRHADHRGLRVILADDGTTASRVGIELTVAIDWPATSVIRVLASALEPPVRDVSPAEDSVDAPGRERHAAPPFAELQHRGVTVEQAVLTGDAVDGILAEATAFDADLLITSSRRRGVVPSLLGLSVAGDLVDRAPCPVLVARGHRFREVLLTTDGSDRSMAAAEIVATWSIFDEARIRVVTVTTARARRRGVPGIRVDGSDQLAVDAVAARLLDAARDVRTEVLVGRAPEQIVETAARRSTDVIVIGSRGRTGLGRTLLGSVAGEVLASATCSVLIVGPPRRRPPAGW
jgi:monovalent cation/proton antiporter MnhG/PhaG subunit